MCTSFYPPIPSSGTWVKDEEMVDTVIREANVTGRLAGNSPVKVTAERETSTLPAGSLRASWSTVYMTVLSVS